MEGDEGLGAISTLGDSFENHECEDKEFMTSSNPGANRIRCAPVTLSLGFLSRSSC
jgi:hypothetical protein